MKFTWNVVVAICSLLTATESFAHRGNNFGSGGDPIREVFNAGRVFALDLLQGPKESELVSGLSAAERASYDELKASAVEHLHVAEHQWKNWSQSSCARATTSSPTIIHMSYDLCDVEAPNAVAATKILLEVALRSQAEVADFANAKAIALHLITAWAHVNPDTHAKAKSFSLVRGTVTGAWICSDTLRQQSYQIDVSPVGLVKAPAAVFPGAIEADKLEFVTFLTLNQARDQFRAEGILRRLRPPAQRHDNIIYAPTCNYPFALDLIQSGERNSLVIQFEASGRPQSNEGCGIGSRLMRSLICKRP